MSPRFELGITTQRNAMNTNPNPQHKRKRNAANRIGSDSHDQVSADQLSAGSLAAWPSALPSYNPITGHPCNPYIRKPPNFSKLAAQYSDLKPFLAPVNNGQQHTLDFSRPEATVALTKAILKCDWDLDIDIPSDTLCPTVTNRLNYLLELRDLLHLCGHVGPAHILDTGTGFTTIYPLLGCRLEPSWRFSGTDIDALALQTGQANVDRNSLSARITLFHVSDPTASFFPPPALPEISQPITATLCNPPFYESDTDRSAHRVAKSTTHVTCPGTPEQMTTSGGEVAFVSRMVSESVAVYRNVPDAQRPAVFSSMLGIKRSVDEVVAVIQALEVPWYTVRTLRQGVTSRWVVAWSFKALAVGRLARLVTVDRVVSVDALVRALEAVHVPVARVGETAVDVELVLATWTRRWKRRRVFGGGLGHSSSDDKTTREGRSEEHVPSGDGVTGRRADPIQVRIWWANKDPQLVAQSAHAVAITLAQEEVDESPRVSEQRPPPILARDSLRQETSVWIAGPKSDPLMHSFIMFITPVLESL
ncbi:hypothetical protein BCR44DRAFT_1440220, partial [Catenaria anguillulae PL171]